MDAKEWNDERARRSANWTRHWQRGAMHSCAGSFGADYGGTIAGFWHDTFLAATPGDRVLDIATGNGALPRLLFKCRPAGDCPCDAVDLAQVAPSGWPAGAGGPPVRFHAGVQAEQLPFTDASFQLVISQYGLEYSHLPASVSELLRVLAPGGRVALVVHHAQSRPVTLAEIELVHIDWLLSADGLVRAAARLLEPLSRAASPEGRESLVGDRRADEDRQRFNAAQEALARRAQSADGADVLFEAQSKVAEVVQIALSSGLASAREALEAAATDLDDARWRLSDLRQHALTEQSIDALASKLKVAVGTVQTGPLRERGHLMGWSVRAGF